MHFSRPILSAVLLCVATAAAPIASHGDLTKGVPTTHHLTGAGEYHRGPTHGPRGMPLGPNDEEYLNSAPFQIAHATEDIASPTSVVHADEMSGRRMGLLPTPVEERGMPIFTGTSDIIRTIEARNTALLPPHINTEARPTHGPKYEEPLSAVTANKYDKMLTAFTARDMPIFTERSVKMAALVSAAVTAAGTTTTPATLEARSFTGDLLPTPVVETRGIFDGFWGTMWRHIKADYQGKPEDRRHGVTGDEIDSDDYDSYCERCNGWKGLWGQIKEDFAKDLDIQDKKRRGFTHAVDASNPLGMPLETVVEAVPTPAVEARHPPLLIETPVREEVLTPTPALDARRLPPHFSHHTHKDDPLPTPLPASPLDRAAVTIGVGMKERDEAEIEVEGQGDHTIFPKCGPGVFRGLPPTPLPCLAARRLPLHFSHHIHVNDVVPTTLATSFVDRAKVTLGVGMEERDATETAKGHVEEMPDHVERPPCGPNSDPMRPCLE